MRKRMMAVVITLIMTSTFVGCSSTAAPVKETKETEAMVVKEETVEVAEVKEVEAEPTPEPTPEPTEEPTPEPIVYEGIDKESTLPGKEWIATFKGVIEEPKFVVYNDNTNKKVIVENNESVEFEEGDILAVFAPEGIFFGSFEGKNTKEMSTYNMYYSEIIFTEGAKVVPNTIVVELYDYDFNDLGKITCRLK